MTAAVCLSFTLSLCASAEPTWRWQVLRKFDRNQDKLIDASEFAQVIKSDALELMGMPRATVQEAITEAIRTLESIKRETRAVAASAAPSDRKQSRGPLGTMLAAPLAMADRTMAAAKGVMAKGTAAAKYAVAAAEGGVAMGSTAVKGVVAAAEDAVTEGAELTAKAARVAAEASEAVKVGGLTVVDGTVDLAMKASRAVRLPLGQGARRVAVVSESASRTKGSRWLEACDVVRPCEPKTAAEQANLYAALHANRAFRRLDELLLERIVAAMRTARAAHGEIVIRQGDAGDSFYIVNEGTLEVLVGWVTGDRAGRDPAPSQPCYVYTPLADLLFLYPPVCSDAAHRFAPVPAAAARVSRPSAQATRLANSHSSTRRSAGRDHG